MTAFIRTETLIGFMNLVTRLHGDPDAMLRQFHIDPNKVRSLDGVISYAACINLLEEAAHQLDCNDFGLRLSQYQDITVLGGLSVVALNEKTVGEALQKIAQYMSYFCSGLIMRLQTDSDPELALLTFEFDVPVAKRRQATDMTLAAALNACKMLYGEDFKLHSVLMDCDSHLSQDRYQGTFNAPALLKQEYNALVFPSRQLTKPIDRNSEQIRDSMEQFVNDAIGDRNMDLIGQIEHLIRYLLPTMRCSLKVVAMQLGIHPRTLQRRLSEKSLVFEQLLDGVRREAADTYLAEHDMPISQVSGLVGYSDQSSFNRSCRRWFNSTPLERRQYLSRSARSLLPPLDLSATRLD